MFIFHKTEVQTVILRCLTGINIIWWPEAVQCAHPWLTRKKLASGKWPFYKHFLQGSITKSFVKKFKTEKSYSLFVESNYSGLLVAMK